VTTADMAKIAILLDTALRAGLIVTTSYDGMVYSVRMESGSRESEGFASTLDAALRMAAQSWRLTDC